MKVSFRVACIAAMVAGVAPAHASLELAQKHACVACHAIDKKLVGPSYLDVAKKYAGQADAAARLAASIRQGGSGKWGAVPMPPQPALSDADVKALAAWVASQSK